MPLIRTRSLTPVIDIIRRNDLVPEAVMSKRGRIYFHVNKCK